MDGKRCGAAHAMNIVDGVSGEGDPMHMRTLIALSAAVLVAAPAYAQTTSAQSGGQTTADRLRRPCHLCRRMRKACRSRLTSNWGSPAITTTPLPVSARRWGME